MGYGLEVELIARARALDLLTTPYVFSEADARDMARAGADIVVCHLGLTTGGAIGAETALTLDDCVAPINAWAAAAQRGQPRRDRAVPRRPDRDARRRQLHPARAAPTATASTAPARWSACRPRWRSPRPRAASSQITR